jgi:LacI family transcriptional regulator
MPNLKKEPNTQQASKRVTLLDVANASGLSRATVSLVLRGSPLVAEGTRKRVQEVMQELGYVYHRAAANMRSRKSHTVGLVVADITNPFFAEMTVSIGAQLDKANYVSLLFNTSEMLNKQEQLLSTMQGYSADGILLCPARGTSPSTIEKLQKSRLPFVLFARYIHGVETDYVGADNVVGARAAVEHLISLGHCKIAFIGGPMNISSRKEREQGWRQALIKHDLPINESFVVTTAATREGGAQAIHQLLELPDKPTACLCFNDVVAFGVMLGLQSMRLQPGADFAVIGFDDVAESAMTYPTLTTIAVSPRQIGEEAVKLLLDRIEHPEKLPRKIILHPQLVIRESCGHHLGKER